MNKKLSSAIIIALGLLLVAGTAYVPPASSGSSSTAVSGDFLAYGSSTTWTLTDWVDAGSIGGATTVKRAVLAQGGIVIKPKTKADDTTASGARSQGALTSVASGDFLRGFRIGVSTDDKTSSDSLGDTIDVGVAFVDGTNVGSNSWYGVVTEYSSGNPWYYEPAIYYMSNTSGTNRWDTASSYTAAINPVSSLSKTYDLWVRRSGTTLSIYIGKPGATPSKIFSWSVSTGAGLAGIRFQMWGESAANTYNVTCTLNYSATNSTLPWEN